MPMAAPAGGSTSAAAKQTQAQTELELQTSASQADTEPLSFDDEDEDASDLLLNHAQGQDNMDAQAAQDALDAVASAAPLSVGNNALAGYDDAGDVDAEGEEDLGSDDEDAPGEDEAETEPVGMDDSQPNYSHNTAAEASGDVFSDDSELSDESDEVGAADDDEDEEEDDDEMGDDDEDEDADGEEDDDEDGEAEEDDEEDAAEDDDEDEAAEGLAALTAGVSARTSQPLDDDESAAQSGLDGLSVLAAAGADESEQSHDESDTDSIASSRRSGKFRRIASQPKASSRLKEVTAASSIEAGSDASDADDDDEAVKAKGTDEDAEDEDHGRSREMSSLGGLSAAAKKKAARLGPGAGLLAGAPAITVEETGSGAQSAATSREGSPKDDDEEPADNTQSGDEAEGSVKDDEKLAEGAAISAQDLEEAALEEDPSTDEAAIKRQDAVDILTKIEIGFAVLRDKLYVERMEEVNKEGEMILDGTHPDLLYLTNLIEARRERRLRLTERYFEQQQAQSERVAQNEEFSAHNNWRNEVSTLRKKQMEDISRKRRKLDREKRLLDGPRPARRHQVFETELVRNPHYDEAQARLHPRKKHKRKAQQEIEDLDEMGAYVAYPDLRSAEDGEAWMDMERMGIQPDPRLMQSLPYYRLEEMGMDPGGAFGGDNFPPQQDLMGYGGPPPMQGIQDGPMMERHFDAGPPQPAFLVDNYGNPVQPQMYGGHDPHGRIDDGGMMSHQVQGMPPAQLPQPVPSQRKAAGGGRKASPGPPRLHKPATPAQNDDRHRKMDAGGAPANKRMGNAIAQGRTPPSHPRPAPQPHGHTMQQQQQHHSHHHQHQPHHPQHHQHLQHQHHNLGPPNLPPPPSDMGGGMSHRPPAPGPPYMGSYGGGGHMPEHDGYYGGGGPPPGAMMQGAPYQRGPPGPSLPPLQPPQRGAGQGGNGGPPGPPFDMRPPPGEPMYSR